jgi:thiol-disulfide isomerase/thioredoxin
MKIILLFLFIGTSFANNLEFETTTDNTIEIKTFNGDSDTLIIYLPNHRGLGNQYSKWATKLTFDDISTWALDLHTSYMMAKSKASLEKFNIDDLVEVVHFAYQQGFKNIYLLTSGRGAKIALHTAYAYQQKHANTAIKGHIFHSPHLIKGSVEIGKKAQYEQIAKHSNIPIYIMLTDSGTKFMRKDEISTILSTGGSQVFNKIFKNISAGFTMRPNSHLTSADILARSNIHTEYKNAIMLLQTVPIAPIKVITHREKQAKNSLFKTTLTPLNTPAHSLQLPNKAGDIINLRDYKNKVVLVNFWASWCTPCVKEIPSLIRLKEKVNHQNFEILTINIGESQNKIQKFQQKLKREQSVDFNLPILFDTTGVETRKWKIYAYPSNYIIDKNGVIKYGYRGALEWDREDIVQTINALLYEK